MLLISLLVTLSFSSKFKGFFCLLLTSKCSLRECILWNVRILLYEDIGIIFIVLYVLIFFYVILKCFNFVKRKLLRSMGTTTT